MNINEQGHSCSNVHVMRSVENKGRMLLPLATVVTKKLLAPLRAKIIDNLLQEEQVGRVDVLWVQGVQDLRSRIKITVKLLVNKTVVRGGRIAKVAEKFL